MTPRSYAALALCIIALAFAGATAAHAQLSPCDIQTVENKSSCDVLLELYDDANGQTFSEWIPGNSSTQIVLGTVEPDGVISAGGNKYAFTGAPAPGCSPCYTPTALAAACCITVCYDRNACLFTIDPCPAPCQP